MFFFALAPNAVEIMKVLQKGVKPEFIWLYVSKFKFYNQIFFHTKLTDTN